MKQRTKWFVGLAMAAVLALSAGVFAACTDPDDKEPDDGGNETVAVEGISFAEDEITLEVGQSVQLEVIFTPENATNKNVIWSVDFDDTATVDENGLVTAKEDAAGKACTVTATAEEGDGLYEAYCSVTVIEARGEAITKTAEVGGGTNTLTLYELGGAELTGNAAAGDLALEIEPYSGNYSIQDNAPVFTGTVTAMGFNFPILVGATFQDQQLQLRLYLNNGSADFELGTYEFTKEEAARLVGSTHIEGGIDTTVAYVQATIAGSNAADSVALWSDGKAVFTVGQFVPAGSSVAPISFETTWKKVAAANTIEFAPVSGTVDTKGQEVPGGALGSLVIPATPFGDASTVTIGCVTDTKNGITVTVSFTWEGAASPASASFNMAREAANSTFGFEIPYIETVSIAFDASVVETDGKYTLALASGASLDLYATSTLSPAEGVTDLASALTVSVALKEGAAENVVTISGSSITGFEEGTTTVVVTVDGVTEEIKVTVAFPANAFADANVFDADVTYSNDNAGLVSSFAFKADGTFYYEATMMGMTLFRSYGYYNIADGKVEVQYFNFVVGLLYGADLLTGVASYDATVENGEVVSFTITGVDDTTGEPTETVFTPAE